MMRPPRDATATSTCDSTARASIHPGFVKGWSIDRAAAILDEAGLRNYALNAGGDLLVRGGELPEPVWRFGIQHPLVPTASRR